jgi:hypothetical protein
VIILYSQIPKASSIKQHQNRSSKVMPMKMNPLSLNRKGLTWPIDEENETKSISSLLEILDKALRVVGSLIDDFEDFEPVP